MGGGWTIQANDITLQNPAAICVQRYRYRGQLISTPWNEATLNPTGARYRSTRHDDTAFLGYLEEALAYPHDDPLDVYVESPVRGNSHAGFGGRRRGNHRPKDRHGASPPTLR